MNTRIRTSINAVKDMIRAPYAWPGGYSKVLVMSDGESMCAQCVKENYKLILRATRDNDSRSGWAALYEAVHWEGAPLQCANCNQDMPSEYGDPDAADAA
jgi:hypothetical protein